MCLHMGGEAKGGGRGERRVGERRAGRGKERERGGRGRGREGKGKREREDGGPVSLILILSDQGPTLMASFKLNYICQGPRVQIPSTRGAGLRHMDLGAPLSHVSSLT